MLYGYTAPTLSLITFGTHLDTFNLYMYRIFFPNGMAENVLTFKINHLASLAISILHRKHTRLEKKLDTTNVTLTNQSNFMHVLKTKNTA